MGILILMLIIATIVLAALVFMTPAQQGQKVIPQPEDISQQSRNEQDMQTVLISSLEEQLFSQKDEADRLRAEHVGLVEELEATKKREDSLREELIRQKDWYDKKVDELDKLKNEYIPTKTKLEKELSEDVDLNRMIMERDQIIESLKKENKELSDQLRDLRSQQG